MTPDKALELLKDMYSLELAEPEIMACLQNVLYHADMVVTVFNDHNFSNQERAIMVRNLKTALEDDFKLENAA